MLRQALCKLFSARGVTLKYLTRGQNVFPKQNMLSLLHVCITCHHHMILMCVIITRLYNSSVNNHGSPSETKGMVRCVRHQACKKTNMGTHEQHKITKKERKQKIYINTISWLCTTFERDIKESLKCMSTTLVLYVYKYCMCVFLLSFNAHACICAVAAGVLRHRV